MIIDKAIGTVGMNFVRGFMKGMRKASDMGFVDDDTATSISLKVGFFSLKHFLPRVVGYKRASEMITEYFSDFLAEYGS